MLAGLSDQATLTGHPDHALQLARAGRAGLGVGQSYACLADLWALQARAEAAMGDRVSAQRSVIESERAAERIQADDEPEWARIIDPAYLNREYATPSGTSTWQTRWRPSPPAPLRRPPGNTAPAVVPWPMRPWPAPPWCVTT